MQERCEELHVVETINWARAHGTRGDVHLNRYFAVSLADAIGIAARIEVLSKDIAENVVAIRPASEAECEGWRRALEQLGQGLDRGARAIADEDPAPATPQRRPRQPRRRPRPRHRRP
jgi:hypothetical protein